MKIVKEDSKLSVPEELIVSKIFLIRNRKVMLDSDLALLYGVTTGNLNKAVSRNISRFPEDFMFQLTTKEFEDLVFQIGRASWGGRRIAPKVFSEQGVAMLSSVLNSDRAISVNIQIIRVFTRMRELISDHKEILQKLVQIEQKDIEQDKKITLIFKYMKQLETARQNQEAFQKRKRVGFKQGK